MQPPSFCMIKQQLVFLFLLINLSVYGQIDSTVYKRLKAHILFLASDSLMGRAAGSQQELTANNYVKSQFLVTRRSKNHYWNFSVNKDSVFQCQMVGSFVSNKSPFTLLVGAHIDHIGLGGPLSKSLGKKQVHNGADDNASGVALLIELQRYFAKRKLPFNLLVVAYTAHEIGTFGSEYLSQNLDSRYGKLVGVFNWDMVGRLDEENHHLYISCNRQADSLFGATPFINPVYQDRRKLELLDTRHFLDRMIPCATFNTGMHADYHKVSDDALYIHYEGLYQILRYFEQLLEQESFQNSVLMKQQVLNEK
jgi:hypothetical protein